MDSFAVSRGTKGFPRGSAGRNLSATHKTQETWAQSPGQKDPLEKEKATHSSILVGKIPWTEESGRMQFMGSQGVEHDWATEHIGLKTAIHALEIP